MQPDKNEMKILTNALGHKPLEEGLDGVVALRSIFQCIQKGWLNSGRLTPMGTNVVMANGFKMPQPSPRPSKPSSLTPKRIDVCVRQLERQEACNRGTQGCVSTGHG